MDSLSNKHLAIDASIWLHQFLRGMRDKDGEAIGNAHILGFYRRICKLLYFNVKPIFVFDGGTPALKRLTIVERRKQRRNNENMVKKTAEKLFAAQLRLQALEQRKLARKRNQDLKALNDSQPGAVRDSTENPVYLEEPLDPAKSFDKKDKPPDLTSNNDTGIGGYGGGSKAKRVQDKYVLPPMETDFDTLAKIRSNDERFGYHAGEDDVSAFLEDFKKEEGLNNIDSDVFKALPSEMQYEILQEIRQRSRVTSFERVQEMVRLAETPMDFSKLQVQGVIRRNTVTHKLLTVNQTVSKVEETVKPGRIASQRNRQYLLVKNEEGGWVLGGRKPTTGATADKPVQLDSDDEGDQTKKEIKTEAAGIKSEIKDEEDEEGWESDDDDDLEMVEVKDYIPPVQPAATLRPLAPKTNTSLEDENSLVNHPEAYVDEDESIEKVMAKFAEIEDEAARKRGIVSGLAGTEALPMDVDELDSFDTLNSLDTVYSDATMDDMDDFEDLMEDEETGEIVSRKAYERKQLTLARTKSLTDTDNNGGHRRALSEEDESQLEDEALHSYWVGYTPESFKHKHVDFEFMLQAAITEWEDEQLSDELHSAKRKLEKSNVNDTAGVEVLRFWTSFLESVATRRQLAHSLTAITPTPSAAMPVPLTSVSVGGQQPSRISHLDSYDDGVEESGTVQASEDDGEEQVLIRRYARPLPLQQISQVDLSSPMASLNQPEQAPDDSTKTGSVSLHLDFGSSILKQRSGVSVLPVQDDIVKTPEDTTLVSESTLGIVPQVDAEDLAIDVDVEPTVPSPKRNSATPPAGMKDEEGQLDSALDIDQHAEVADEIEYVEEEEDEDDAHSADLENEEQDFTNLFPDMASLPGALLISKEAAPTRTAEEQRAMDEQGAAKMFEESQQLQSEIKGLRDQHRKHQRNAEDLTESMIAETQMLLKLFGIPYIVAPMEAEAQCADLQLRGVVEGILTEDSDVFLFGGVRVFKNVFREEKYVECYLMSDVERDLGVGRDRLVSLAYLLGSDYTTGIKGVGLVTAMEILRLFPKLEDFAKWWRGEQVKQNKAEDDSETREKSLDELGMELDREVDLSKLAKQCKKIHLPSTFPDPHIADAYIHPMVDDDDTKFQWGIPDLDGLRDYLRKSMSWDRGEVDRVLLPIIRQMAAQASQLQTQTTLDSLFDSTVGIGGYHNPARKHLIKSARLRKVVNGLTGQATTESDTGASDKASKKKSQAAATKKLTSKRVQVATDEKANKTSAEDSDSKSNAGADSGSVGGENDIKDSGDDVMIVEMPKEQRRTRGHRTPQTKVPEAVIAAKRQLQSKTIEAKLAARDAATATAAAAIADTNMSPADDFASPKGRKRAKSSGSSSSSGSENSSGDEDEADSHDFAPSHWDLLEERQRQQRQQLSPVRKKTTSTATSRVASGRASSLTAMVSASNAARYGSVSSKSKKESARKKART
ncbi:DNA repair protein rad2 [Linnemannia hyalina]|uniref:DNA repair protein rad2 n=1 Tax=Linnemannia hyalina TaxID=64524 RepID=A0A9P7XV63_9FUNG|nr:DNA repair protein rad2 [Linnemannia hyalina]